ncbi:MAG: cytochrome ubiquinol oxidase subunit I [Gemmatimonadetes bacterium]|nr:cytochrome ubiquinol oxidase subunit I [Gemmatimonadota bacterium]
MDGLTAARAQMEVSLGFHMIFAALGIGLPLLMVLAEGLALRTGRDHYRALARTWAKATALTFAVGAVSGTALSFELGLLWPRFMAFSGAVIGSAFALEGYAFFIEAIFIGLYLYGWDRLSPFRHWLTGIPIAVSGLLSGVLVVAANAWMQVPGGIREAGGTLAAVDPLGPFRTPAWIHMAVHSSLSCYIATGFGVAGVYALGLLKGRRDAYHRSGLGVALAVGAVAALLQPLSGDYTARQTARHQPAKLAAMEAHFRTQARAPLLVGGLPDERTGEVRGAIRIPAGLSLLVARTPDAVVPGLDAVPPDRRPPVAVTHLAFDLMVGSAFLLLGAGALYWFLRWRRRGAHPPWLLRLLVAVSPLGFLALEAGWVVAEAGRQPWVVYGVMRTADAVTPVPHVGPTFLMFTLLYLFLGGTLALLLRRLAGASAAQPEGSEAVRAA